MPYNFTLTDLDSDMFSCGYFLLDDVCRFCWTRDATIEIFPNTGESEERKPLSDKILNCLNIDINTMSHPKRVCDSCANHIETFYSFKKFCKESDRKLIKTFEKRIPLLEVTVKIEDVQNPTENLEESAMQNENNLEEIVQNKQTKIEQNTIQKDPIQNSLNHKHNEDDSESDSTTLVTSKKQVSQDVQSMSNNADIFVEVESVTNNVNVEDEHKVEEITVEMEMDSLDRLLSKIHGEYQTDCDMIATEIESMEIETNEVRSLRTRSKTAKKENLKTETVTPKHSKRCPNKKEETKPNELKEFCKICGKDFVNISELAKHNNKIHKVKDDGKSYMCYGCDKSFATKKQRFNHELRYCKGVLDGYKCPKCDTHLQFRKLLERHVKDHKLNKDVDLPEILFVCKICKKPFKTKEKLQLHRSKNHPLKKYVCETCGRVFKRPDYLQKHRFTHTDVRQHRCVHCPYSAVQRSSLVYHMRTHTGDRPYACDQCPKRCVTKSNLNAHKRRHVGTRTHQCQLCPKTFAYKSSLIYHTAHGHANSDKFICHHCHTACATKRLLTRHMRDKHVTGDVAVDDKRFDINLPPVFQNIDYEEFNKFEEGFNEKNSQKYD